MNIFKRTAASVMAAAVMLGAGAVIPEAYENYSVEASAAELEIHPALVGVWYYTEDDSIAFLTIKDDCSGQLFIGSEQDYILGNYDEGLYGEGYFTVIDGILYPINEPDDTPEEGVCFSVQGEILELWNDDINVMFRKYGQDNDFSLGDVNSDGSVDSSDASFVLSAYAAAATGNTLNMSDAMTKAADVNSDSAVDSSDASSILAYYAYAATGGSDNIEVWLGNKDSSEGVTATTVKERNSVARSLYLAANSAITEMDSNGLSVSGYTVISSDSSMNKSTNSSFDYDIFYRDLNKFYSKAESCDYIFVISDRNCRSAIYGEGFDSDKIGTYPLSEESSSAAVYNYTTDEVEELADGVTMNEIYSKVCGYAF